MKMLRIRFYNLGQYPQEEQWLHEMAAQGWIIQKSVLPCFYFFQKEKPQDIVYRFDFLPCVRQQDDSINLFEDYGWKYITQMNDFVLFCKQAKDFSNSDLEIFSSPESKNEMIMRILKSRLIPVSFVLGFMILLCIYTWVFGHSWDSKVITTVCTGIVFVVVASCWIELMNLKKKIQ
ncbi:DUF2812 domain-containing protein [Ileibacterium valens]|uniref:DUF2812 domain-containing protein n=1 Tax=Ileibacterium valens TaxID=1862668 RepID=A0A1U7NGP1_9FIRM|nr:DUF2812 domain-containing protein [Ileibacterium valens]OLU39116.1 hypothetical protein BM735_08150 [Erysipelotrichaceae bacterium NYU-BL-F16]OLU40223.1 hypothetical protein BO224_06095 [Erysipelotrichaceae bacterium NYU-BL-E8]OLU40422.1 hypothetical protein BO222_05210 [Ileibacterium valens]